MTQDPTTQDTSPTEAAEDDLTDVSEAAEIEAHTVARESYMAAFRDVYEEEFAQRLGGTLDDEAEEFMRATVLDVEEWLARVTP